jgi:hypothetical protein
MIGGGELASKCRGGKEGVRFIKAHWTVDPAWQNFFCFGEELIRLQSYIDLH